MSAQVDHYSRDHRRNIQRALNETCYMLEGFKSLNVDGIFGKLSVEMLKRAQNKLGAAPTGVYEDPVKTHIEEMIKVRYLSEDQIRELATQYDVEYALLRAIIEIESRGYGFLTNSRATILYERHIFHREVTALYGRAHANELAAKYPDIINTKTGGYLGYEREWTRLEKAMSLPFYKAVGEYVSPALRSASWGLGQVMGFHAERLGYADVYQMFAAAMRSEKEQVEIMLRYCISDPAFVRAMKNHDWHAMARLYNGPNYAASYPINLQTAYRKFS